MDFSSVQSIESSGFSGFNTVQSLWKNSGVIPDYPGVYLVLRTSVAAPVFLHPGVGGFFKGKDPNLPEEVLRQNVVEGTPVVYIGKAGGGTSSATLRKRLKQYLSFGQGKNIGHYGGRLIWQLQDHADLLFCWKPVRDANAKDVEKALIADFESQFNKLPFANLAR